MYSPPQSDSLHIQERYQALSIPNLMCCVLDVVALALYKCLIFMYVCMYVCMCVQYVFVRDIVKQVDIIKKLSGCF